jgi:hypothetical protein
MGRDPINAGRYMVRNSVISTGSLIFFIYNMFKMAKVETNLTQKYFSHYSMD